MQALPSGSWGGSCLSVGDYVIGVGPTDGAPAPLEGASVGYAPIAWQWLLQAIAAAKALAAKPTEEDIPFYRGKIHTCCYFFAYELPKIGSLAACLKESGDGITVAMKPEWFE